MTAHTPIDMACMGTCILDNVECPKINNVLNAQIFPTTVAASPNYRSKWLTTVRNNATIQFRGTGAIFHGAFLSTWVKIVCAVLVTVCNVVTCLTIVDSKPNSC